MIKHLNRDWKFVVGFAKHYVDEFPTDHQNVQIPHNAVDLPCNYFSENDFQGIFTYQKEFELDKVPSHKVALLQFDGIMCKGHVYVNGVDFGEHPSLYLPFEVDITKALRVGRNVITVKVDSREQNEYPPFGYAVDYLTYSGIYREVSLRIEPRIYFNALLVNASMERIININPIISNELEEKYLITYELLDLDDNLIESFGGTPYKVLSPIELWDTTNPKLYKIRATLHSQYGETTCTRVIGFRNAVFRKDGFYLNGKKVKLLGLNRHQSYPIVGYAMPRAIQEEDAEILKRMGCNVVRTSHYPQSEHFLTRCDQLGLMVIDEIPGWQHIDKSEIWRKNCCDFAYKMILKESHHPSLILYGTRIDESADDDELYINTNQIAKELDSFRQTTGVRMGLKTNMIEDVFSYNDFNNNGIRRPLIKVKKALKGKKDTPYLITECNGHMYPTKSFDTERIRVEHAKRHLDVINAAFEDERICGIIPWCFVDYGTHRDFGSGDHVCYHGVFDAFRNEKYASYVYESQQEEHHFLKAASSLNTGDNPEAVISRTYIYTNCDYIDLYKGELFVKRFYPNRKVYRNLKHPPIILDDYIGETFNEENIQKQDHKKVVKALMDVSLYGYNKLPFRTLISVAFLMMKYHWKFENLYALWSKYISGWGQKHKVFKVVGFKNDTNVISRTISMGEKYTLRLTPTKTKLVEETTYDATRIKIELVDENDNRAIYTNKAIAVECSDNLQIVGPRTISLLGGATSVYIRSNGKEGKATFSVIDMETRVSVDLEIFVK